MKKVKDELIKYGIRPTYQRMSIYSYLDKNRNHPTADKIYSDLVKKIPTMSRTTVYNTLDMFLKNKIIKVLTIKGNEARYDIDNSDHHHFLCRECGRIIDVDVKCPYGDGRSKSVDGHRIEEIHGYFKGICKDCLRKNRSKEK